jgi:hypothetical protein
LLAALGEFGEAVEALKVFARADAKRIILRNKMRAKNCQILTQYLSPIP